ncbi:HAD-IA family hydrolase [Actinokineospora soli]|uniref:HAD-IA family hydrolase n=1 Tax=Actinokineospora soli TaxID=1048753 RepID=A0ABW2TWH9_9PSEU
MRSVCPQLTRVVHNRSVTSSPAPWPSIDWPGARPPGSGGGCFLFLTRGRRQKRVRGAGRRLRRDVHRCGCRGGDSCCQGEGVADRASVQCGLHPARASPLFDAVVVSGEVGFGKPDRRIYELVARQLGVSTEHCVYVDDVRAYVRGAVDAGMTGVHHTAEESTVEELAVLLGL